MGGIRMCGHFTTPLLLAAMAVACEAAYVGPPVGRTATGGQGASLGSRATTTASVAHSKAEGGTRNVISEGSSGVDISNPSGGWVGQGGQPSAGGSTFALRVGTGGVAANGSSLELGQGGSAGANSTTGSGGASLVSTTVVAQTCNIPSWRNAGTGSTEVDVCWSKQASEGRTTDGTLLDVVEPANSSAKIRRWVREAVENTWGRSTNLSFPVGAETRDWPVCSTDVPYKTLVLDFTKGSDFADVGIQSASETRVRLQVPQSDRAAYTTSAIRAFGWALGLLESNHDGILRPFDIAFAQSQFGRKHSGALVGWGGRCTSVRGAPALLAQGNALVAEDCDPLASQRWRFKGNRREQVTTLSVSYSKVFYCATNLLATGAVVTGPCLNALDRSSVVALTETQLIGWGGLCVTVDAPEAGAALVLAKCGTSANEQWTLLADYSGMVRLSGSDLCATVTQEESTDPGVVLRLDTCSASASTQRFDLSLHDHIRYDRDHCVGAEPSQLGSGARLTLQSPCSNTAIEQMFHAVGKVRYDASDCMMVSESLSYPGAPLVTESCRSVDTQSAPLPEWQQWDYHW